MTQHADGACHNSPTRVGALNNVRDTFAPRKNPFEPLLETAALNSLFARKQATRLNRV